MTYEEYATITEALPRPEPGTPEWKDYWQKHISLAQQVTTYEVEGEEYSRIRYGDEKQDWGASHQPCHDCNVVKGQFHVPGCDVERCPKCHGQAISCDCDDEDVDDLLDELQEIAANFRDTFRHNKVSPALQEWREERVERLDECIKKLREEIERQP